MQRYDLLVHTDYRQFFIFDDIEEEKSMVSTDTITDEDFFKRIGVAHNIVAVYTSHAGYSQVAVELHDAAPPLDLAGWDHVAEGSLQAPSGDLTVMGIYPQMGTTHLQVPPGCYRVRVHQGGLAAVTNPDARQGGDHYLLSLWPAPADGVTVLKQYEYQPA